MPTPTIPAGNLYMNATTYTGNGTSNTVSNGVAGKSFQPDFVWVKNRTSAYNHYLYDSIRGVNNVLQSNLTSAEATQVDGLDAFLSNGYSIAGNRLNINESGSAIVAWQWKAGGTAVSNTAGSITSSVSANTTSGFSVVTYTGVGGSSTVGHGLGVVPSFIAVKNRTNASDWELYHSAYGANYFFHFNNTSGASSGSLFPSTPTSTVFSINGTGNEINQSGSNFVAYCWAPIAGYSAFGSYTGNGSTDGPFVYLGFRPRYVMIKRSDGVEPWLMLDSARQTYNVMGPYLLANASDAEATFSFIDFTSNGFKIRNTGGSFNTSGGTYIYMAFAENPFKYANAR